MDKKLSDLLEGTAVSPKSHPVLVSLLMMAAQGAGIGKAGNSAARQKQARAWHRVCLAFRRALDVGITDEMLVAAGPFPGLMYGEAYGWRIRSQLPLTYRDLAAGALDQVVSKAARALQAFDIRSLEDLRKAIEANGLPAIEAVIRVQGKLEAPELLPGRRMIVRYPIRGRSAFSLLQADEFGRLEALTHERSPLLCRKFHASHPPAA